jgi:hypothetical protein
MIRKGLEPHSMNATITARTRCLMRRYKSVLPIGFCSQRSTAQRGPGFHRTCLFLSSTIVLFAFGCSKQAPSGSEQGVKSEKTVIQSCLPRCDNRVCGEDGCRGKCGECPEGHRCDPQGRCELIPCVPKCNGRICGDDGCGAVCGKCNLNHECRDGQCEALPCKPDCAGRTCGDDGCEGSCGTCEPGLVCRKGHCVDNGCQPDCAGKDCGNDGCGGSCGVCPLPDCCSGGNCERRIATGLFVGSGTEPWRKNPPSLGELSVELGRPPAIVNTFIGFPADWAGECAFSYFPEVWINEVLAVNPTATIMLSLLPQCNVRSFIDGFEPDTEIYDAVLAFARRIEQFPVPVFIRFAHDMNTHWYPWATCNFGNARFGCLESADDYRTAFRNVATLIHQAAPTRGLIVWSPREWKEYWGEKDSNYPTYADFYPGDDVVDWVGLDIYYVSDEVPGPGEFANRIRAFYNEFSAPEGHGKPMMIAETAAECHLEESLACISSVGDFNSMKSWWDSWGALKVTREKGPADKRCPRLDRGHGHLVFSAPDAWEKTSDKPPGLPEHYVGSTALEVDWATGHNFSKGNVFVFSAYREETGGTPVLQVELCDSKANQCPEQGPCCDHGTVSARIAIEETDWTVQVIPLSDFKPTLKDSGPAFDWSHVKAVKLHLLALQPTDELAVLHLDGMALGNWSSKGRKKCRQVSTAWAEQVFAAEQCSAWPNLKALFWHHDRKEVAGKVKDYRIENPAAFKQLLSTPCWQGNFW